MSQTAVRGSSEGWGHRSNTQGTDFICGSLEMLCLPPCSSLSGYRSPTVGVLHVVALQQHRNQNHSFIQSMNEWPHPVRNVCMLALLLSSILVCMLPPRNVLLNTFPVFDVKGRLWPVLRHLFCLQTSAWLLSAPWRTCSGPRLCRSRESWPDEWWRRRERRWKQSRRRAQTHKHQRSCSKWIIDCTLKCGPEQWLSNYSLATITRHSGSGELWISPHDEVMWTRL